MTIAVSRIVTCFRQWPLLRQWLSDHRLRQEGVEWIIVNDAPDDAPDGETLAAIDGLGARLLTPSFNSGRSRARNLGAREAQGHYLEFIDGDDVPLPLPVDILGNPATSIDLLLFPVLEWDEKMAPDLPANAGDLAASPPRSAR